MDNGTFFVNYACLVVIMWMVNSVKITALLYKQVYNFMVSHAHWSISFYLFPLLVNTSFSVLVPFPLLITALFIVFFYFVYQY